MDRGDMDAALAREVAAAILFDNAAQFHRV
jgi:hypothetical protein